jgi:DUF4097 and DUF4098 domain-containing protein YvlB
VENSQQSDSAPTENKSENGKPVHSITASVNNLDIIYTDATEQSSEAEIQAEKAEIETNAFKKRDTKSTYS